MRGRIRRPSAALVISIIALLVALGGTGYAALKVPRNSVGAVQLKANAVTSSKVRDGSLVRADFAPGTLLKGDKGDKGDPGLLGLKGDPGGTGPSGVVTTLVGNSNGAVHYDHYLSAIVPSNVIARTNYTAGTGEKATVLAQVETNAPYDTGVVMIPTFSTDNGTTWGVCTAGAIQEVAPNTTNTPRLMSVVDFCAVTLTPGARYIFGVFVADYNGAGFTDSFGWAQTLTTITRSAT